MTEYRGGGRAARIKQYADPMRPANWQGASTQKNIDRWSKWAHRNSAVAPRASDGPSALPSTGKVKLDSTSAPPRRDAAVDARMVDSRRTYLPKARRV